MKNVKEIASEYLAGKMLLHELAHAYNVKIKDIKKELEDQGYIIKKGYRLSTVIGIKKAVDEYLKEYDNEPSISKIADKYHIKRKTLSDRLKTLGYEVINHQNKIKFDINIFDDIDTEEKAYWLGFIYADGYVSDKNDFELSLALKDIEHLRKFNNFLKHDRDVRYDDHRCRLSLRNKHFADVLKHYGCIPRKSLILKFPDVNIFKNINLVKDFIRGYVDGDGCLSYGDKKHQYAILSILGTEDFLNDLQNYLPTNFKYQLGFNNKKDNILTRTLQIHGKNAFHIIKYLYQNSMIYLDRKYLKYLEFCRLYE